MLCWVCSSTLPSQVVKYSDVCLVSFQFLLCCIPFHSARSCIRAYTRHIYWFVGFVKKLGQADYHVVFPGFPRHSCVRELLRVSEVVSDRFD